MANVIPSIMFPYHHKVDSSIYPYFLVSVGHFKNQIDATRKGTTYHEFHWITKGSGIYNINGENITLSAGDCIFMKRGFKCNYKSAEKNSQYSTSWVAFLCEDSVLEQHNMQDFKIFKTPSCADKLYDEIIRVCKNGGSEAERSIACYTFLVEMLDALSRRKKNISGLIKNFLSENYSRNITLNDVANFIGMTPSSLCRYLKKHKEVSYVKQLRDIRISNAKSFLKTTDYQVSDIGVLCGFEDASYFGKIFKKETGLTPLEYREKHIE